MKKMVLFALCLGVLSPLAAAKQVAVSAQAATAATDKVAFQARRKQIKRLIKKYKKAPLAKQAAIKEELTGLVGEQVDAQLIYMKNRLGEERTKLNYWEAKIKADEENLPAVKAQRVEELLSGEAQKKQKAAKKAWKQQLKEAKK